MPCKVGDIVNKIDKEVAMVAKAKAVVVLEQVQVVQDIVVMVLVTNSYAGVDRSTYQTATVQDLNPT